MNTGPIATNKVFVGLLWVLEREVKRVVAPSGPIATKQGLLRRRRQEGKMKESAFAFSSSVFQYPFILFHVILEAEENRIIEDCNCASCWVISTARLNIFLYIHLQPINVVVYNDPCVEDSSSG